MTRIRCSVLGAAALAMLVGAAAVGAQQVAPPAPPGAADVQMRRAQEELMRSQGLSRDPLADAFFPPELVMQHQQAIGLTSEQRAQIVVIIAEAQPRFVEAQWQLQPETAALAELVRGDRVNEQQVLAQIDRVLDIERQIKRLQMEMLIRIKNQLTLEQQQQLARLGGVRLRGLLDSRSRPAPFGDMFMPDQSSNFYHDAGPLDHGFWLDDSAHWLDDPTHWLEGFYQSVGGPTGWTPAGR